MKNILCSVFFMVTITNVSFAQNKTSITPEVYYRTAGLKRNKNSAYHKSEHKNFVDQLYVSLKLSKTIEYRHQVFMEAAFRTKRNNPDKMDFDGLNLLDQAYVESSFTDNIVLSMGKRTEYRGSGAFVNPSDLTHEDKDLFDPLYQKSGKIFSRLSYVSSQWSLGLAFIPKRADSLGKASIWLLSTVNVLDMDIILQGLSNNEDRYTFGMSVSRFFGDIFELHLDSRYQSQQRSETEFLERFDSENLAYKKKDPSFYSAVGTRIVFTPKRNLILEYINNQSGLLNEEFENVYLPMIRSSENIPDPPSRLLKRSYAFMNIFDEQSISSLRLGLSSIYSLADESYFVSPSFRYSFSKSTSLEYSPLFFLGDNEQSEFAQMPFGEVHYLTMRGSF